MAFLNCNFINAQCTTTQTAGLTISTTTVIQPSAPAIIKICPTGIVYDTLGTNSVFTYFMEAGSKLIMKKVNTVLIYMKSTSGFTNTVYFPGNKLVYTEPGTSIVNTATGTLTPTNCTLVTFPTAPSCALGITVNTAASELINVYPNPAKNNFTVSNENNLALICNLTNALGQKVKSFTIETAKKTIDVSDLNEGIYYLSIIENAKIISQKKLVIVR